MTISLSDFTVRQATRYDLPSVCKIEDGAFPDPYPANLLARLQREYSKGFLVAENDVGQVLGYCVASEKEGRAHLISVAIQSKYLRRGIGSLLLKALLARLSEHCVDEVLLEVNVENEAAIKFYERFGFERIALIENYYSDGSDALKMRLSMRNGLDGKSA